VFTNLHDLVEALLIPFLIIVALNLLIECMPPSHSLSFFVPAHGDKKPHCGNFSMVGLFWLNDDQDVQDGLSWVFWDHPPEVVPPKKPDYQSNTIVSTRDLEDWTRLWFFTKGFNDAISAGTIKVGLKWKNVDSGTTPGIKIVKATDTDGGIEYIQSISSATTQATSSGSPRSVLKDGNDNTTTNIVPTSNAADFVFPTSVWSSLSESAPKTYFLFEGTSEGKGQLEVVFLKSDGTTKIGEGGGVWLQLLQIKKMYDRGHSNPITEPPFGANWDFPYNVSPTSPPSPYTVSSSSLSTVVPSPSYGLGDTGSADAGGDTSPAGVSTNPPQDEASQLIVFVHGICVTDNGFNSFSQTMFKRLWWAGYKGRFAAFQWSTPPFPTDWGQIVEHPINATALFNNGEYHAWYCGQGLKDFVSHEKSSVASRGSTPTVGIVAHSLGNVVANSAYAQGMHSDYYAALEGAISLSCFFSSQNTTGDPTAILSGDTLNSGGAFDAQLVSAENPGTQLKLGPTTYYGSHTPDYYRGLCTTTLSNVSTQITNFHNPLDYWLQTGFIDSTIPVNWQKDQYYAKPTVFFYATPTWSGIESQLYGWNMTGQSGCAYRDDLYDVSSPPNLISSVHRPVNDTFEQVSYIARSRTLTLGAQSSSTWASLDGHATEINLETLYDFGGAQNDHSGIFNRSIQQLSDTSTFSASIPFYDELRYDLTGHNLENP